MNKEIHILPGGELPSRVSPRQLAEYLDLYDADGKPNVRVISDWKNAGKLPPPKYFSVKNYSWKREEILAHIDTLPDGHMNPLWGIRKKKELPEVELNQIDMFTGKTKAETDNKEV